MKNVLLLLSVFIYSLGFSQFTGTLVDQRNEPIAFANIVTYSKDNKVLKGVISDEKGIFKIPSEKDCYLKISFVGFETKKITPTKKKLGIIILKDNQLLEEVTITARKRLIEQKVDRLVFNFKNSISNKGGTALDALKDTPSVTVDQESLSIIGKGTVRVLINDRLIQMSEKELVGYLNGIPADDIEKIEVITTPPAKYDAEGNGGLINIVLKKAKNDSWSNQTRSSFTYGIYGRGKIGNTFNYNKDKVNYSLSLNADLGNVAYHNDATIYYPTNIREMDIRIKRKKDNFSGRLNLDYQLTQKATLGFSVSTLIRENGSEDFMETRIKDGFGSYMNNDGQTKGAAKNNTINAHYIQKISDNGKVLSVDLDYFNFNSPKNNTFTSQRFITDPNIFKANNISKNDINNYSVKTDIAHPTSFGNFSYGAKFTNTKSNSSVEFYDESAGTPVLDTNKSNEFQYEESIKAVYVDFTKPLNKKLQLKLGLRAEQTNTKGFSKTENQTNNNDYKKLFPTLYASYTNSPTSIFSFNYNRRLNRPSFWALNPFRNYLNANSYTSGNPFLKPSTMDNIELQNVYKGKFITKLFGTRRTDAFGQFITVDKTTKIQKFKQENFYNATIFGITETIMYNPTNWWNTVNVLAGYYMNSDLTKNLDTQLNDSWVYQIYNKNTFFLNTDRTIQLEGTVSYQAPTKQLFAEMDASLDTSLAVNFKLLDNKLNCNLAFNDIFKRQASKAIIKTSGVKQTYLNDYDTQNIKLSLSYNFGSNNVKSTKKRQGNKDEIRRTN